MQSSLANSLSGAARTVPGGVRRRAEPRIAHRVPCEIWLLDPVSGVRRVLTGRTVNLSASGIAVHVGEPVACGTTVEALMLPAPQAPRRLAGAVRHVRRVLTGTFELGIETWAAPAN
jgi:hypothetical protein